MRHLSRTAIAALIILCGTSVGNAIPQLINYQGILTNAGGAPITVPTTVVFRIWDMAAGGAELWGETRSVTPDADGRFSILLGSVNPILPAAIQANEAYLGITIAPDAEMFPRTRLVAVAYAFRPGTVDGATGGQISGDVSITGRATIGSGHTNTGAKAFVAGEANTTSGSRSAVGGGDYNTASGLRSAIGGGHQNTANGEYSTVGGGYADTASDYYSTVGGGYLNAASGYISMVGGGAHNTASYGYSTVGGGFADTASGYQSTVGGGGRNVASGECSIAGGGYDNTASGIYSTVGGGLTTTSSGAFAVVPGGRYNEARGYSSFAAGNEAYAKHGGTFVWADSTAGAFASTAGNQFLIRASGGVGIGTNSTWAGLHVKGAGYPKSFAFFDTDASAQDAGLRFCEAGTVKSHLFHQASSNTLCLYGEGYSGIAIAANGNVGIGTTAPTARLHVAGDICYTGTIGGCSDARYKTDVKTLPNALDKVSRMRGVNFNWKVEEYPDEKFTEDRQTGFIAQELREILPEVVMEDANGYLSVDYGRLTPVLVEAIKAQQEQIDELRQLIAKLASPSTHDETRSMAQTRANIQK